MIPHWFDFVCPRSYVAQDRNALMRAAGLDVVDLPLHTHPEIGPGGAPAPSWSGPEHRRLAAEAWAFGLPLRWPARIPDSRTALAAAEIVRDEEPEAHARFVATVFHAYFAQGRDLGDLAVLQACAAEVGLDPGILGRLAAGRDAVDEHLRAAEALSRTYEVSSTPSWLLENEFVEGLPPLEHAMARSRSAG